MLELKSDGALEIPIVFHCNLNCNYCAHMSPYMANVPMIPINDVELQCKSWYQRIAPKVIRIIGGEPLLHPHIAEIVVIISQYWNTIPIDIVTNGLRINQLPTSVFDVVRMRNVRFKITIHSPLLKRKLTSLLEHTKCNGYFIDSSKDGAFIKYYTIENGIPKLHVNDSQTAYNKCYNKHKCHELMDNQLYHCSVLPYFRKAQEYGVINDERVLDYQPATVEMSDQELIEWYNSDFSSVCTVCPAIHSTIKSQDKWNDFRKILQVN